MKKITLILFILSAFSCLQAQDMKAMDMSKEKFQQITYTCSMHPEIHATKPGNCPKCGMKLNKEKAKTVKQSSNKENVGMPNLTKEQPKKVDKMQNMSMPIEMPRTLKRRVEATAPKTVRYDLFVKDTLVNYAGKEKRAISVNGQIPMPTLTFTEGDTAEIVVHNQLKESTSLHWHGVFLPNKEDGVPWLTQKPIKAGTTYTYRFPIIQHGTHWYHSHSGLQEQIGMYGSFIMKKRDDDTTFREGIDDLPTVPIILSEWTNLNPNNINRMLHNANDWAAIK